MLTKKRMVRSGNPSRTTRSRWLVIFSYISRLFIYTPKARTV